MAPLPHAAASLLAAISLVRGAPAPAPDGGVDPRAIDPSATSAVADVPTPRTGGATLPATTTSPTATPGPSPAAPIVTPLETPKGPCLRTRGQCRRLTITGTTFAVVAAAAIGTGIGLVIKPDEKIPDQPIYLKSYEPAGVVLIGMGVGVLLTGVLMIIAGRRAHRLGLDGNTVLRGPATLRF